MEDVNSGVMSVIKLLRDVFQFVWEDMMNVKPVVSPVRVSSIKGSRRKMTGIGMLLTVGLTLGVLAPSAALAQPFGPPEQTITTQGRGEVRVQPDSMTLSVAVESRDAVLAKAREDNNRQMQAIHRSLKALGVANLQLETQTVRVSPIYAPQQPRDKAPRITGYQVSNTVLVRVTNSRPDLLGEQSTRIMDAALNAGANNVYGLNFYVHDMSQARAEALQKAVEDARRNAQAMAQAANVTIKGVHSIEGTPQYGGYVRPMAMMKAAAAPEMTMDSTPIEVGESTITSDVTVRFQF